MAELGALAAGRADLLAEVAGIFEGASEGRHDEPLARCAAGRCRKAGADQAAIPQWIEVGRERAARACLRRSPVVCAAREDPAHRTLDTVRPDIATYGAKRATSGFPSTPQRLMSSDRHMPLRRTGQTGQSSPSSLRAARPATGRRTLPKWARPGRPVTTQPPRDRIQLLVAGLPGFAAVVALIFSVFSLNATHDQLQIAEQGQITDRYNAAITNLGSRSVDVRLGGIYALQRIMQDSPPDQPTVVAVLCAFVRDHAIAATARRAHRPTSRFTSSDLTQPPADIRASLAVVSARNTADDSSTTVVDFAGANLSGANLAGPGAANFAYAKITEEIISSGSSGADLSNAILTGANLSGAILPGVNLSSARLTGADLSGALFANVNLSDADLSDANLTNAYDLSEADLFDANLADANLTGADLSGADLSSLSSLSGATLAKARLSGANLTSVDLSDTNLTGADLTGADLTGAKLTGAKLTGAKGLRTSLPRSPTGSTPASNLRRQALMSGAIPHRRCVWSGQGDA